MTTTALPLAAERYLAAVREHLHDLPDDERDELVDDLASHLAEVASDDDRPLEQLLGPPEAFAAELLASAGVAPAGAGAPRRDLAAAMRARAERLQAHPWAGAVRAFLPDLRPAWWVARGYLWVLALSLLTGEGVDTLPLPRLLGTIFLGVPAATAAIVASVRLGRRPAPPRWVPLLDAATAVAALLLVVAVQDRAHPTYVYYGPSATVGGALLGADGDQITNIFPYDADGRLLDGVLLYDQHGEPIELGEDLVDPRTGEPLETEPRLDANGAELGHAYPMHQWRTSYDDSGIVPRREPVRPPAVVVPRQTTTTTTTTTTAPPAPEPPAGEAGGAAGDGAPPRTSAVP